MLFGACFYSFLIGTMSSFLRAIDSKGHILADKFIAINELCKQARIRPELKDKIKRAVEYRANMDFFSVFEKDALLSGCSIKIQHRVMPILRRS